MITGMTAGVSQDMLSPERADGGDAIQSTTQLEKLGFFELAQQSLSLVNVQDRYSGGESETIQVRAVADKDYDTQYSQKVVTMYKCADSTCKTPPPIDNPQEDSCDQEEWYPEYDDCIAHNSKTVDYNIEVDKGQTVAWNTQVDIPNDKAQYILVGYVWKDGIATDVSKHKFVVGDDYQPDQPDVLKRIQLFIQEIISQVTEVFK